MLDIDEVSVEYGPTPVLKDVSLEFPPGSTALMGPSGSGKSTLLRVMAGKQAPTAGMVTINGSPVERASWRSSGDARIAMVFQDYRLVPFLTVADNIALAAEARQRPISDEEIRAAMARVGLAPEMADRAPTSLSGGEQQRVAIARALVTGAEVILADEPTGALDTKNSRRVSEILKSLGDEGLTVVVATHDEAVAATLDRTIRLDEGER
ncbi:MAG: ABC transporter ATP-binding protein [Micropruina sp.]